MNTKFTKGEWFIEDYETMLDVSVKGGGSICTVKCGYQLSECLIDPTKEEQANAHLIASAPALYKSLERQRTGLINLIELSLISDSNIEGVRHEISLIDNELAKARGE